jgi:16S rRNA (cytosine1402-N4)-methyltransferase
MFTALVSSTGLSLTLGRRGFPRTPKGTWTPAIVRHLAAGSRAGKPSQRFGQGRHWANFARMHRKNNHDYVELPQEEMDNLKIQPETHSQRVARVHVPVLADAVRQAFAGRSMTHFVDGTLGAGGHATMIIADHPELEHFIGIDRDRSALELASKHLEEQLAGRHAPQMHFLHGNFRDIMALCQARSINAVDGILLDLGVSSMQLDHPERGFSFGGSARARSDFSQGKRTDAPWDAPLDMRMDQHATGALTAQDIVNTWSESELYRILRAYGEEPRARQIARGIVEARRRAPIETTGQLATIVLEAKGIRRRTHAQHQDALTGSSEQPAIGTAASKRRLPVMEQVGVWHPGRRRHQHGGTLHPATLTFQALRIAVNDELGCLEQGLQACIRLLRPGGRLAVISFHRLEDRIVKWTFRAFAEGQRTPASGCAAIPAVSRRASGAHEARPATRISDEDTSSDDACTEGARIAQFCSVEVPRQPANDSAYAEQLEDHECWRIITKKPIVPSPEEVNQNPRSRSAKLRIIENVAGTCG